MGILWRLLKPTVLCGLGVLTIRDNWDETVTTPTNKSSPTQVGALTNWAYGGGKRICCGGR
jgi:hypothetical protein